MLICRVSISINSVWREKKERNRRNRSSLFGGLGNMLLVVVVFWFLQFCFVHNHIFVSFLISPFPKMMCVMNRIKHSHPHCIAFVCIEYLAKWTGDSHFPDAQVNKQLQIAIASYSVFVEMNMNEEKRNRISHSSLMCTESVVWRLDFFPIPICQWWQTLTADLLHIKKN